MTPIPEEIDAWAREQLGLVTLEQLLTVWSPSTVRRRRRDGLLLDGWGTAYRLVGSPRSWRQRALGACLALGPPIALSGLAAGYLYRVDMIARPQLQVTVPPDRAPSRSYARVRRQLLPPSDVTDREHCPVTTPARTLIDLSRHLDRDGLQRFADELVRRRLLTAGQLRRRLAHRLPDADRAALEEVVDRLDLRGVGDSHREDWVMDTLVDAGLPPPVRHVRIELGGRIRELDGAYPESKVAIEYDGWRAHSGRRSFDDDRDKSALLQNAGWIDLQVTSAWTPEMLVSRAREAIARQALRGHHA